MKLTVLRRGWDSPEPMLPRLRVRGPGCGALLAVQLAILLLSIRHMSRRDVQQPPPTARARGADDAAAGDAQTGSSLPAATWPTTSDLSEWVQLPYAYTFRAPQSQCLLHPDGAVLGVTAAAAPCWRLLEDDRASRQQCTSFNARSSTPPATFLFTGRVELPAGHDSPGRPPFLWDTGSMPDRAAACAHCDPNQKPPLCCGVCVFEGRRCDAFYPGEGRSEAVAQHLGDSGFRLQVGGSVW